MLGRRFRGCECLATRVLAVRPPSQICLETHAATNWRAVPTCVQSVAGAVISVFAVDGSRPIAALQLAGFSGDDHHVLPLRNAAAYAEHPLLRNSEEICIERGNNATTVSWWNQWTLVTTWVGRGEKTIVGALADALPSLVGGRTVHYFVADTLAVVGYDMSLRQPTSAVLDCLKRSGMEELVVIASSPALRMLAFALGLAVVKRTRVFETREQAIDYCAKPPGVV